MSSCGLEISEAFATGLAADEAPPSGVVGVADGRAGVDDDATLRGRAAEDGAPTADIVKSVVQCQSNDTEG